MGDGTHDGFVLRVSARRGEAICWHRSTRRAICLPAACGILCHHGRPRTNLTMLARVGQQRPSLHSPAPAWPARTTRFVSSVTNTKTGIVRCVLDQKARRRISAIIKHQNIGCQEMQRRQSNGTKVPHVDYFWGQIIDIV